MKRGVCVGVICLIGAATGCATAPKQVASPVLSQAEQQALTPAAALAQLKEGNQRFARGETTPRDHLALVKASASAQHPMAVVLSCLDSRVPVETIFDRGIGDLFVARVAGNFENTDILGSMEFATRLAGAKLIVVLGHTNCGAVKGACDGAQLGNLTSTLANIVPAVEASRAEGERSSKNPAFVAAVTHTNVTQTMADLTARSPVLKELVDSGKLSIAGGIYDLETGVVEWLAP